MVKGSTIQKGTDGAGNDAVGFPVLLWRPLRRPKIANDNPAPRWLLVGRCLMMVLILVAALSVVRSLLN